MESRLSGRKLKPLPPDPFRHQNSAIAPNTRTCAMNTDPLLSQFRISAAMRPYVLRVRPRGTDFADAVDAVRRLRTPSTRRRGHLRTLNLPLFFGLPSRNANDPRPKVPLALERTLDAGLAKFVAARRNRPERTLGSSAKPGLGGGSHRPPC
jgi:hypothetical protein